MIRISLSQRLSTLTIHSQRSAICHPLIGYLTHSTSTPTQVITHSLSFLSQYTDHTTHYLLCKIPRSHHSQHSLTRLANRLHPQPHTKSILVSLTAHIHTYLSQNLSFHSQKIPLFPHCSLASPTILSSLSTKTLTSTKSPLQSHYPSAVSTYKNHLKSTLNRHPSPPLNSSPTTPTTSILTSIVKHHKTPPLPPSRPTLHLHRLT